MGLNIKDFQHSIAIQGDDLYVLEVNPRSSRTVPFVAKSSGLPLAKIAANVTIGIPLSEQTIPKRTTGQICVKARFSRSSNYETRRSAGSESTGEVYGSDTSADVAYLKARLATCLSQVQVAFT